MTSQHPTENFAADAKCYAKPPRSGLNVSLGTRNSFRSRPDDLQPRPTRRQPAECPALHRATHPRGQARLGRATPPPTASPTSPSPSTTATPPRSAARPAPSPPSCTPEARSASPWPAGWRSVRPDGPRRQAGARRHRRQRPPGPRRVRAARGRRARRNLLARLRAEAGDRALFDPSKEATLARRYEAAAERGFFKALKELRHRAAEAEAPPAPVMEHPEHESARFIAQATAALKALGSIGNPVEPGPKPSTTIRNNPLGPTPSERRARREAAREASRGPVTVGRAR